MSLGYSHSRDNGSGIGPELAKRLATRGREIVALGITDPLIFELIGLFEEDFGPDRLSDMAISILWLRFLAFTDRVSKELNLSPRGTVKVRGMAFELPQSPSGKPMIPPCNDPDHPCPGTNTAYIYKNLGGRRFSLASSYIMDSSWAHGKLFTADLNGDLNQDLVNLVGLGGLYEGDLNYRPGNGAAGFGTLQQLGGSNAIEVDFRDLNLDSRQDMVIPEPQDGEVDVFLGGSGYPNCKGASSASLNAKICAPVNNATVNSSVLVTAAGNSPIGVKRLEIWVDGKKVYQKLGDQLNKKITLTSGRHSIAVVAVDKYVGSSSSVRYVNVQ